MILVLVVLFPPHNVAKERALVVVTLWANVRDIFNDVAPAEAAAIARQPLTATDRQAIEDAAQSGLQLSIGQSGVGEPVSVAADRLGEFGAPRPIRADPVVEAAHRVWRGEWPARSIRQPRGMMTKT
jgi:hypothetical protein